MPNDDKLDREQLPSTLERSPEKAQRTYLETLESAETTYGGDEERAHRAAFAAVKHSFEKIGDHWEPKAHNANASKAHLLSTSRARSTSRADRRCRSTNSSTRSRANRRETARARGN